MPLVSSIIGSSQTSKAVGAQVGAANTAIAGIQGAQTAGQGYVNTAVQGANNTLSQVNANEQQNLNPYLQLGQTGASNLNAALAPGGSLASQFSFDPTQIANNPDYKFQLQQGNQAVQRAAAANGTLMSGGTLKALDQYSQGLASNEIGQAYNQAFNTYQANRTNNLQALTLPLQTGLQASPLSQSAYQNYGNQSGQNLTQGAGALAQLGTQGASQIANQLTGIGNAKAAGSVQQGNIWSGFLGGSGGLAQQGLQSLGPTIANATGGNGIVAGAFNALAGLG